MSFETVTIGPHVLYRGRCEDVLPTLDDGSVDLVFTSPPYNLGNTSGGGFVGRGRTGHYSADARLGKGRGGAGKWSGGSLANGYGACDDSMPHREYVAWQKAVLRQCWRVVADDGAVFYNHKPRVLNGALVTPFEYNPGLPVRQVVIWARAGGINFSPTFYVPTHEWVVVFAKDGFRLRDRAASGVGDVWYFAQDAGTDHPAPFPLRLPLRALETTTAETVLDPFVGSGTTVVACAILGRRGVGIEIDPRHFDAACRRVERAVRDQADSLFPPAPSAAPTAARPGLFPDDGG